MNTSIRKLKKQEVKLKIVRIFRAAQKICQLLVLLKSDITTIPKNNEKIK